MKYFAENYVVYIKYILLAGNEGFSISFYPLAGNEGFEPPMPGPEPGALPLGQSLLA